MIKLIRNLFGAVFDSTGRNKHRWQVELFSLNAKKNKCKQIKKCSKQYVWWKPSISLCL